MFGGATVLNRAIRNNNPYFPLMFDNENDMIVKRNIQNLILQKQSYLQKF